MSQLAGRQFGAVARRQLLAQENSASRIDHWLRAGRLHPVFPGVYAWGRAELSTEGQLAAALLLAGPGAALASLSALWWQGLLHRRPHPTLIASPRRCRPRREVRVTHRRQAWLEAQGFTVLRFSWEDVQLRAEWVAAAVRKAAGPFTEILNLVHGRFRTC